MPQDPFTEAAARAALARHGLAAIELHDAIGSTQDRARELARGDAAGATLVAAARQTAGRGRDGRSWASPAGGLWFSLVLHPHPTEAVELPLTIPASLAAARAVEWLTPLQVGLKWPNDLVVGGRKLGGILVDVEGERWVVGVGLNAAVRPDDLPGEVRGEATSIQAAAGRSPGRLELLAAVLDELQPLVAAWERGETAAMVREAWRRSVLKGRRLTVTPRSGAAYEAEAIGLAPTGALRLRRQDGATEELLSGRVEPR